MLCLIDIYSNNAWIVPLKDKNSFAITTNAFQEVLDKSNDKSKNVDR